MSEQTPDTSNGLSESAEPSMEDILASIRKIIADDEGNEGVIDTSKGLENELSIGVLDASGGLEQAELSADLQEELTVNNDAIRNEAETLDLDINTHSNSGVEPSESEIDALIADMDMIVTDDETVSVDEDFLTLTPLELVSDDKMGLEIPMEEAELDSLENLVQTEPEVLETQPLETEVVKVTSDDELSSLLDDMMTDDVDLSADTNVEIENTEVESESIESLDLVIDPAEDLLEDDFEAANELLDDTASSDTDMALVKSLLADLTGEPLHEEANVDAPAESLEEALADTADAEDDIFEALDMDLVDIDDDLDADTDDVMDEILSLTLDDEVEIQAESVAASGVEVPLSLKEIAEQAEADANTLSGEDALAGVAALGAVAAIANSAKSDNDALDLELDLNIEVEEELLDTAESDDIEDVLSILDETLDETPKTEIETPTDLNPDEETTPMPRAAKKDAIIDEVTETAATGAFASLNQVVEEKAVVAERGDRIGDLVQEALRPMLKDWLDANLKGIVERAVTKEVKRISSGK